MKVGPPRHGVAGRGSRPAPVRGSGPGKSEVGYQKTERCPLLQGIDDGAFLYFVHSYYVEPADAGVIALETDYGVQFTSMVWRDRLFATQFHPEKSQAVGLQLLRNFINLESNS